MEKTMRVIAGIFCLCGLTATGHAATSGGTTCGDLKALAIPDVKVLRATEVAAGTFSAPGLKDGLKTTAFCRVEADVHPTTDSQIRIEVWMPPIENWNGKFEGVGNGGYQGNIPYAAMATGLQLGYATAATDTGHTGDDLHFGEDHPEKVIDWSYRAIHLTAEAGKLIVRDHYGRFAQKSYFVGCSTGGHQALSEAQRFPADYDGIVAGDPAYDRVHQTAAYLWSWMATHDATGESIIGQPQLKLVTEAAIASCDAKDGVKDGVIGDPQSCKFDVHTLACKDGASGDRCLTPQQITAFEKVYAGTKNPRTGDEIFPGWTIGSESTGPMAGQGWGAYILDPKEPMRIDVFRLFLYDDPKWDWHTFDFDHDMSLADDHIGYMSAVNADLQLFRDRGNKLLMYTGWADPVAAPMDILKYYKSVTKTMGGTVSTQKFFRFFMVPGMAHCGGGPGATSFDALTALDTWVENDKAPERILASHLMDGKATMTRPLCPYPQKAVWKGSGDSNDAVNFSCKETFPR
jgi:feruloyl esterase